MPVGLIRLILVLIFFYIYNYSFIILIACFYIFYQRINKPNIHYVIIEISSFQNRINHPFSSTGFSFKSKSIDCSHRMKKQFCNFYTIHVLMKAFFLLTIRMPMATKLARVIPYCKELSPMNLHDLVGLMG